MRRELAHRATDGLEVTLLWSKDTNDLTVHVSDARSGDAFELAVVAHNALDVFNHPYAYAAFRGVEYRAADPARVPAYA